MNICYIVAKEAEAAPFIERFNVEKVEGAFGSLPCALYQKQLDGENVLHIVVNGTQHGSSLIGCEAATLTTLKAIETLHPDIVINSGTCGAFKKYGANLLNKIGAIKDKERLENNVNSYIMDFKKKIKDT